MTLAKILASSALATLLLVSGGAQTQMFSHATSAEAAASVNVSIFYSNLAPYGDWIRLRGLYVFVPARVGRNWHPYTFGHWVYAESFGWIWVSDEPFGWATYHYGGWGYDDEIGWYWVPGTRWAPAWVSWRRGGDVVAWAPLPPRRGGDSVSISITVGDIPDYYWVPIPARYFLDVDLRVRIISNDRDRRRAIHKSRYLGVPRVRNKVVVNNAVAVNVVEADTGERVKRVRVRDVNEPTQAKVTGQQVTIFKDDVKADKNAEPKNVTEVTKVRERRRRSDGASEDAQQTDSKNGSAELTDGGGNQAETQREPRRSKSDNAPKAKNRDQQQGKQAETSKSKSPDSKAPARDKDTAKKKRPEQPANAKSKERQDTSKAAPEDKGSKKVKQQTRKEKAKTMERAKAAAGKSKTRKEDRANAKAGKKKTKNDNKARANKQRGEAKSPPASKTRKRRKQCDPSTDKNCGR